MECVCPILGEPTEVDETGFQRDKWSLVKCRDTGFVFLKDPPDYSALETEFAWEETSTAQADRRRREQPVMSRLSTAAKTAKSTLFPKRNKIASIAFDIGRQHPDWQPVHLLDVGCGYGYLMVELQRRYASVGREAVAHGIEVSKQLAEAATKQVAPTGGSVVMNNAVDGCAELADDSMHLVLMSSFLEHECRPLDLLRRVHSVLRPDGAVIIKVPNFACWNRFIRGRQWGGFRYPDHVNYFTPGTLNRLAGEAGFTITRQNLLDRFPLSDNMYAVLTKA